VADEVSKTPGPFDVGRIKSLVALMQRHDLSEIDLHDGAMRIRLRRGAVIPVTPLPTTAPPAAVPVQTHAADAAPPKRQLADIKAPTPGVFWVASNPEAEPFVHVGSRVNPDTVVCLIEAMKLFTEIQAGCSGVIVEILAENQQPVEHGQVLFRVDPTG